MNTNTTSPITWQTVFRYAVVLLVLIATIAYIFYQIYYHLTALLHYLRRRPDELNIDTGRNDATLRTGLDEAMLNTWPKFTYAEARSHDSRALAADCCSFCLDDFEVEGGDKVLRILPQCRHVFHAICVDPWLRRRPICPLCRSPVVSDALP